MTSIKKDPKIPTKKGLQIYSSFKNSNQSIYNLQWGVGSTRKHISGTQDETQILGVLIIFDLRLLKHVKYKSKLLEAIWEKKNNNLSIEI